MPKALATLAGLSVVPSWCPHGTALLAPYTTRIPAGLLALFSLFWELLTWYLEAVFLVLLILDPPHKASNWFVPFRLIPVSGLRGFMQKLLFFLYHLLQFSFSIPNHYSFSLFPPGVPHNWHILDLRFSLCVKQ
jgi:hypothetical protein